MFKIVLLLSLLAFSLIHVIAVPPIQIAVSVRGKKYDVNAETVNEVLEKVEKMANLEEGQQHVLFRGKVLSNVDKLEDIGVSSGDVLNIVKKRLQRATISTRDDLDISPSKNIDPSSLKTPENMSPEDMQKAMQQIDNLLDSNIVEEYFGDDEKLEKSRIQMLENLDQYEKMMPGFRAQAEEIASDPVKWREAMHAAKEQIITLKQKRDAMKKNPDSRVDDFNEEDEE